MKLLIMLTGSKTRTQAGYLLMALLFIQLFGIALLPADLQLVFHEICVTVILLLLGLTIIKWRRVLIPLLVILVTMEYISRIFNLEVLNTLTMMFNILLLIIVIGIYIKQTSQAQNVNATVILQSINGYLLLSLASSFLIIIIIRLDSNAFSFPEIYNSASISLGEAQYLGLVTISTLGYGDITPVAPIAQSVTTLIAILGQLYIAIIIALLVGKFSNTSNK